VNAALLSCSLLLAAAPGDKPIPPKDAAKAMTLPDGFTVQLVAGEPDLVQPIAFTFDDRGRLWVVECLSYPKWSENGQGNDRVLIFEDTKGNGVYDKRTVFLDNGVNLSGIAHGFGGVWLLSSPDLLFIPANDDKPSGPPQVVVDGWSLKAKHNVCSSLTWGPDGWLYGCNGIIDTSFIGKPGTPKEKRTPINCGVWRYHPTRQQFEAFGWGTTNPWGLDFDDYGEAFVTNCVIHHLWHVAPGAHFQRMYGEDLNPNTYKLLPSIADYIHWAGGNWTESRGGQGAHSDAGGGHAHVGAAIYLGDAWPKSYRNTLFTCNLHGNRLNNDGLEHHGSGYRATRQKDFLFANDPWFRGIAVHQGPYGLFVSDWCDTGECHNYEVVDRTNGRLYKVTYQGEKPWQGDLAKLTDAELVKLQLSPNDWFVRRARRLLQERAAAGKLDPQTHTALRKMLADNPDVTRKLRALWALHVTGGIDEKQLLDLMRHDNEYVRGWAVRLSLEDRKPSLQVVRQLGSMAAYDPSPSVRLQLASGLQRMPDVTPWPIAERLAEHTKDADDLYLPLMIWYGVADIVPDQPERALAMIRKAHIPLVREHLTRRLATLPGRKEPLAPLVDLLGAADEEVRRDVLRGLQVALTGRRSVPMPAGWDRVYPLLIASTDGEVRERGLTLAAVFDDERAFTKLTDVVRDGKADRGLRERSLQTLVFKQRPATLDLLNDLLSDRSLRGPALRGLAAFNDPKTPERILKQYATFSEADKADAVQTLASRPTYALALLDAIEKGTVARGDVSTFTARQLQGLKDKQVSERLAAVWGSVRPAAQEKVAQTKKFKTLLTADYLKNADRSQGRAVFVKHCASCHKLFGEGGDVGPELTGSQRNNLDYVLENVLDPSAVVAREYQVQVISLKNGRVLNGIVKAETEKALTLRTLNETVVVPKDDIEMRSTSPVSMMPDGLFDKLTAEEVRDLVAYLAVVEQVPLPK
jgi:putative membrane-bound dehydrogenase-like protein